MRIEKIRKAIEELNETYNKQTLKEWDNERVVHYEFFKILFSYFSWEEMRDYFKWEYPIIYKTDARPGAIDIIFLDDDGKWIAIEIEYDIVAEDLRKELKTCMDKMKSKTAREQMSHGFIVPLIKRPMDRPAKGQNQRYGEMIKKDLDDAKNQIGDRPIEIITNVIFP